MKKDIVKNIVSLAGAVIAGIIAEAIPNVVLRLVFILFLFMTLIFYLQNSRMVSRWKDIAVGVTGAITVIILIVSIVIGGTGNFWKQLQNFVAVDMNQEAESVVFSDGLKQIEEKIDDLSAAVNEYEKTERQINNMETELTKLSSGFGEYQFWNRKENQKEIEEICEKIPTLMIEKDEEENLFPNLLQDKREVELFYKMRLSRGQYYYCNIIDAFKMHGIDCEEMSIDEYSLLLWDVEMLFATYSMRKDAEELEKGVIFEEVVYHFDDYKIIMSEYSDTFDYGGWRQYFDNISADDVKEKLDSRIMEYYKKINMNFNTRIE